MAFNTYKIIPSIQFIHSFSFLVFGSCHTLIRALRGDRNRLYFTLCLSVFELFLLCVVRWGACARAQQKYSKLSSFFFENIHEQTNMSSSQKKKKFPTFRGIEFEHDCSWLMYYNIHYHHRWTLKSVVSHTYWYWMHITRYRDLISVGNCPGKKFSIQKNNNNET